MEIDRYDENTERDREKGNMVKLKRDSCGKEKKRDFDRKFIYKSIENLFCIFMLF